MKTLKSLIRPLLTVTLLALPLLQNSCGRTKITIIPDSRVPVLLPPELKAKYGDYGVTEAWMKDRIEYELQQKLKRQQDSIALLKCK